jgi:hypothetical protein
MSAKITSLTPANVEALRANLNTLDVITDLRKTTCAFSCGPSEAADAVQTVMTELLNTKGGRDWEYRSLIAVRNKLRRAALLDAEARPVAEAPADPTQPNASTWSAELSTWVPNGEAPVDGQHRTDAVAAATLASNLDPKTILLAAQSLLADLEETAAISKGGRTSEAFEYRKAREAVARAASWLY